MLRVGLTGGIAAGKSLAAATLRESGAALIDSDQLARTAVEPNSEGLREIVAEFGQQVLGQDGRLDRAALGSLVFSDPQRRARLNAIVHPRVRQLAARAEAEAAAGAQEDAVVVHDIPLLVETGQSDSFHLVLVIDAPEEERVRRMVQNRGLSEDEAWSRIRAQADAATRNAAADIVLQNTGTAEGLIDTLRSLWSARLRPFALNLKRHEVARRSGGPQLVESTDWPQQAALLTRRLKRVDPRVLRVAHIGSTAVPGLPAKDVLDLQLSVASLEDADAIAPALAKAGFPAQPGSWRDNPKPAFPDPAHWEKRLHGNADPGRPVNLHVRVQGSPGWRYALAFRDWLRANPEMAAAYLAEKERCRAIHAQDTSNVGYAECKEGWFTHFADPRLNRWADDAGWSPENATDL